STRRTSSPPGRSSSASRAAISRSAPACRSSCSRSSASPPTSSCTTSTGAGPRHEREPEKRAPFGAHLVLRVPRVIRRRLSHAAALHVHHLAQDERGDLGREAPLVGVPPDPRQLFRSAHVGGLPDVLPQLGG